MRNPAGYTMFYHGWADAGISDGAKMTLMAIYSCFCQQSRTWYKVPTVAMIVEMRGMCDKTIRMHYKELEKAGIIKRKRVPVQGGGSFLTVGIIEPLRLNPAYRDQDSEAVNTYHLRGGKELQSEAVKLTASFPISNKEIKTKEIKTAAKYSGNIPDASASESQSPPPSIFEESSQNQDEGSETDTPESNGNRVKFDSQVAGGTNQPSEVNNATCANLEPFETGGGSSRVLIDPAPYRRQYQPPAAAVNFPPTLVARMQGILADRSDSVKRYIKQEHIDCGFVNYALDRCQGVTVKRPAAFFMNLLTTEYQPGWEDPAVIRKRRQEENLKSIEF